MQRGRYFIFHLPTDKRRTVPVLPCCQWQRHRLSSTLPSCWIHHCARAHRQPPSEGTSAMTQNSHAINRRHFLVQSSALVAGLAAAPAFLRAANVDKKLVIGVMGLGRGLDHVRACLGLPDVEIAYVCDVDDRRIQKALGVITEQKNKPARMPQGVKDFRTILDDKSVDALTIAAPNHWHAPAAI